MRRPRKARFAALVLTFAVVAGSAAACTTTDPPAADIITQTFTLGPFDLQPDGTAGDRAEGWRRLDRPTGDIAVKTIRWRVLDGADNELPSTDHRIHFHHVVAYSTRHRDPMCPYSSSGERWAAPGSERTPLLLPNGYGYFAGAGDVWTANYDIMNLTDQTQAGIHVEYDITFTRNRSTLRDVQPYWLDLANCSPAGTFAVPGGGEPGSIWQKSESFILPNLGVIVGVRSHMHDGGIDVTTTDPTGKVICRGTAVYDDGGGEGGHGHEHGGGTPDGHAASGPRIKEIPFCANLNEAVAPGEKVTVTARYHNEQPLDDAMAKTIVYVSEVPPAPGSVTTTSRPRPPLPPPSVPPTRGPVAVSPGGSPAPAWPNFPYPPEDGSAPDWPYPTPPVGAALPAD
jgi:hypothetical protein